MDLRHLPDGLTAFERVTERRRQIESELDVDLESLSIDEKKMGHADEKNCEQMFGAVPIPVGYAGPLSVTFSSGERAIVHLPLATTEGALVASVNRGCKAVLPTSIQTTAIHHGITRSMAFRIPTNGAEAASKKIHDTKAEWQKAGEETSSHLKIIRTDIDHHEDHLFLTISCDTDEAMGMNMVTIAAQEIGMWIEKNLDLHFITVAGNVDSDKKPSKRTHEKGRGFEVTAETVLAADTLETVLHTTQAAMLGVARAKLEIGSHIAGALGKNLHAANVIAALYLATGQDPAHVVEGSLADTTVTAEADGIRISVRIPAILVGICGGGTTLPAQSQCLLMLTGGFNRRLHPRQQLAESIGAAVLAGEVSLLAAQASHSLAKAHEKHGR